MNNTLANEGVAWGHDGIAWKNEGIAWGNEGITWCKLAGWNYDLIYIDRTGKTGRTNADNEPCIQIPLTDFKDLI